MDYDVAKSIIENIQSKIKGLYISGSFRRGEEEIGDIDFITRRSLSSVLWEFQDYFNIKIVRHGLKMASIIMKFPYHEAQIDIWHAKDKYEYKFLKWMRNMDKGRSIAYRKMAKEKGLVLSDYGLEDKEKKEFYDFDTLTEMREFLKSK